MTSGIIIQARMTSKRFPGKSLALLAGKPVLAHVIERAKLVPFVDKVVVAMPAAKESDSMGDLCEEMGVAPFYGPEDDVLKRYYLAATYFDLSTIMRITGDCPFTHPVVCGSVLAMLERDKLDFCSNVHPLRTYPKGLDCEVFSFDLLEVAHKFAETDYDREHVTPWMVRCDDLKKGCVRQQIDASSQNWCIDTPDDLIRLSAQLADAEGQMDIKGRVIHAEHKNVH